VASTWDPGLAEKVGAQIGRDARAKGRHFLLGPGVNIYRSLLMTATSSTSAPGETRRVGVPLNTRSFAHYDVGQKQWRADRETTMSWWEARLSRSSSEGKSP
jgi:hypothetical protein